MCIWYYCLSPLVNFFLLVFSLVLFGCSSRSDPRLSIAMSATHHQHALKPRMFKTKKKGLDTYHFSVNSQLGQSTMRCIFLSSACLIDYCRWPRRRHILIGKSNSSSENRPWYSKNGAYLSNSGSSRATEKWMPKLHVYLLVVLTCMP